jgi:hypothetical protein
MSPNAKTRAFLLATALALLVGCSQPPVQSLSANTVATSPIIVATLSTNACEERTAPVYTAAIVASERGARYVRSGELAPSQGEVLLALGRQARADLNAACPGKRLDSARLAAAEATVREMQLILGGVR